MNQLAKLVDHCVWANELWIRTIAENRSSDEFLVARMSHILHGEKAWFDREIPGPTGSSYFFIAQK